MWQNIWINKQTKGSWLKTPPQTWWRSCHGFTVYGCRMEELFSTHKSFIWWAKQQDDCRDEEEGSRFVEVNWTQECKLTQETQNTKGLKMEQIETKSCHGGSSKKTTEDLRRTGPGIQHNARLQESEDRGNKKARWGKWLQLRLIGIGNRCEWEEQDWGAGADSGKVQTVEKQHNKTGRRKNETENKENRHKT